MRSETIGTGVKPGSVFEITTAGAQEMSMPFYIKNAGLFMTTAEYSIDRNGNTGYLLFYTSRGIGTIITDSTRISIPAGYAAVIDCSKPHKYYCDCPDGWDFSWISFNGSGVRPLFDMLYPEKVYAVNIREADNIKGQLDELTDNINSTGILSYTDRAMRIHRLLHSVIISAVSDNNNEAKYNSAIRSVTEYIRQHYKEQITLDDILDDIPVSRYHFIRLFHNATGFTPYSYLTAYRITMAKKILCSTEQSISEIGAECGFLDTSQFIRRFKKLTELTPLKYRMEFKAT